MTEEQHMVTVPLKDYVEMRDAHKQRETTKAIIMKHVKMLIGLKQLQGGGQINFPVMDMDREPTDVFITQSMGIISVNFKYD